MRRQSLILILWLGLRGLLAAQEATSSVDSLAQSISESGDRLILKVDSSAVADSLEEVFILRQIEELKTTDRQEKKRLEKQLDSLKAVKSKRQTRIQQQVDSLRTLTPGIPVVLFEDTVFYIYSRIGPFGPAERAQSLQRKLEGLVDNEQFDAQKLHIEQGEETHDLMHGDVILFSLTDRDAFWYQQSRGAAALHIQRAISQSIQQYQEQNSLMNMAIRIGLLLLVLAILYFLVKYLNKGGNWLIERSIHGLSPYLNGLKLKEYEFLSAERERGLLQMLFNALKLLVILVVVYLSLPVIFSIFPGTQSIAHQLISYILQPLRMVVGGFIAYIPEMISMVVILVLTRYIVRFLYFLSTEVESGKLKLPNFYPDWAKPTFNLLRIIIYAFAFVAIFPYLPGSDSQVFRGVSVFFGLLISLGSSSAISNIIAGLVITYMRAFKLGDRVKIGDTTGDVVEKTMLVTRVRTIKNEEVTIPNAAILNGSTVNYSTSSSDMGLILHTTVTIGYDVPWRQVHELLIEAALKTPSIEALPAPFVLQTGLDDFYVSYQLNAFTRAPKKSAIIYSDLHAQIQDAFARAGVEIMSPHYRAHRDGPNTTPPPQAP